MCICFIVIVLLFILSRTTAVKVEEGNNLFNLRINRQVIPDQSVLRELQQLLVYFNMVCTCVRGVNVSRVCVREK